MKKQYLEAGKIVNTHGTRGEVKILPWTNSPEFLVEIETLYIDDSPWIQLAARVHKGSVISKLSGIDHINAAMSLKNKVVYIDRADVTLPEGEFFIQDILGAAVVLEDDSPLGTLADVMELPSGNVYVVKGEREILIPAVPAFVLHTDVAAGKIKVRLIEGM